jgi:hypothetical protein
VCESVDWEDPPSLSVWGGWGGGGGGFRIAIVSMTFCGFKSRYQLLKPSFLEDGPKLKCPRVLLQKSHAEKHIL